MSTETFEAGTAAALAAAQSAEAPKRDFTDVAAVEPAAAEVKTEEAPKVETQTVESAADILKEVEEAETKAVEQPVKAIEETAKKEDEEPKKLSAGAARRQRQREAQEADRKKIAELQADKDRLEREKKELEAAKVDTDTAENYDEAVSTNAANTALSAQKATEIERANREIATAAQEAATKAKNDFAENGKELAGVKDFEAVVFADDVPFTQDTVAALMEIDNGPAIAYDLATKPEKLAELNALSPTQRAIKLGQMSATNPAPKPAIETKAPEPIAPTQGGGGLSTGKPESEMTYAEIRESLGMNQTNGYKATK